MTVILLDVQHLLWVASLTLVIWCTINSAIPVCWSTWLSKGVADEPESGGGLMVGCLQLAIMLGVGFGSVLLDHLSITATFIGGATLLLAASIVVGSDRRRRPDPISTLREPSAAAAPTLH